MAIDRYLTTPVAKIVSTYYQPDTGRTVIIKAEDGTTIATATEAPASSGNYQASWDSAVVGPKWGNWYVDGVAQTAWGRFWLGRDIKRHFFYNVPVWVSSDTPTGAVGTPKIFTTGSGALATDSDGNTSFNFTKVPSISFVPKQTRMPVLVGNAALTGTNVIFSENVTDSGDNYDATYCYADIIIESRD